jgi:hypothetical protein
MTFNPACRHNKIVVSPVASITSVNTLAEANRLIVSDTAVTTKVILALALVPLPNLKSSSFVFIVNTGHGLRWWIKLQ